jgi:uncharacterized protein (TIGR01777 family)
MEKVVIFGGTGFIGRHLIDELKNDYEVIVISRHKHSTQKKLGDKVRVERLRKSDISKMTDAANGAKAIVNLAGENVGSKWTNSKMDRIQTSRAEIDSIVVRVIRATEKPPEVLIQGSAIGIYGYSRTNEDITEETSNGQRGFLPKLAITHEDAVKQVSSLLRLVFIRTGMVLGNEGGALPKMVKQFNSYVGGKMGDGKQWYSWIHIKDEVRAIRFLIESKEAKGAYNLTAPNPVRNEKFASALGSTLGKPSFLPSPSLILRLILGSMANELLLSGVKVLPGRLLDAGFKFDYSNIDNALEDLLK